MEVGRNGGLQSRNTSVGRLPEAFAWQGFVFLARICVAVVRLARVRPASSVNGPYREMSVWTTVIMSFTAGLAKRVGVPRDNPADLTR